jgi:hypothetical protein
MTYRRDAEIDNGWARVVPIWRPKSESGHNKKVKRISWIEIMVARWFFWVIFTCFCNQRQYLKQLGSSKSWLELKIESLLADLACPFLNLIKDYVLIKMIVQVFIGICADYLTSNHCSFLRFFFRLQTNNLKKRMWKVNCGNNKTWQTKTD